MNKVSHLRIIPAAILLAGASIVSPQPAAGREKAVHQTFSLDGWRRLTLGFERPPLASAVTTLGIRKGRHEPTGREALIFTTRSIATLLGARGFEEETTSYIDPESNRPIEFGQLRPGDSERRYTFFGNTIRQIVREPLEGDPGEDPGKWKQVESVERTPTFPNGEFPAGDEWITDFYSLVAILGRLERESRRPLDFVALYRRHLVRVRVAAGETRTSERSLVNETTGKAVTVSLRERRLTITPLGEEAESFRGLLGMRGETEFWIEESSGAPVEIAGTAPIIGMTRVTLKSFLLE